ncbi:hypothetical protein OD91_0413 [Lutibacter sp. Hel_I_33_5]|uniref:hypothetical protein n=1 Tax=Lutibacter sp. Hel_I_33_5 TaxID=1566289 RepID=UPI0011A98EED|nr:hypothetical protein [Lutibacter sp. Hel_I_33_5]TVZ55169.1 hypothetical protein OD91_0413 [Lutibacter sp. Hel_I_33_5]
MKKVILLLFLSISLFGFSQQKSTFWDNVRFGGGFGLSFGSNTTILLSPSAVYDFENGFALGAGLNYTYSELGTVSTNIYGISLISLYQIPVVNIQLSGEYEQLWATQTNINTKTNLNFPALYIGAAYNKGRFAFGFRYDVLYDENQSIYASPITPIVRFYF